MTVRSFSMTNFKTMCSISLSFRITSKTWQVLLGWSKLGIKQRLSLLLPLILSCEIVNKDSQEFTRCSAFSRMTLSVCIQLQKWSISILFLSSISRKHHSQDSLIVQIYAKFEAMLFNSYYFGFSVLLSAVKCYFPGLSLRFINP